MGDLVQNFIAIRNDGVKLFKSLQALVIIAKALVHESQIVNSLDAVSLNTDSLQEKLLCAVKFLIDEERVAFVDKSF